MGQAVLTYTMLAMCVYFLMASTSSERQSQVIRFREVTHDYMVVCNAFSAITLPKYGESHSLVNYSSQPVTWHALRLKWFLQHFLLCSCMQLSLSKYSVVKVVATLINLLTANWSALWKLGRFSCLHNLGFPDFLEG